MAKGKRGKRPSKREQARAAAQRRNNRTRERVAAAKARYEALRAAGRRPGCPDDFEYPADGAFPMGDRLATEIRLAVLAYRFGLDREHVEALEILAAQAMDIDEYCETLERNPHRLLELTGLLDVAGTVGPDEQQLHFKTIAPLAGELGLTYTGLMEFLVVADTGEHLKECDADAEFLGRGVYYCQCGVEVFELVGFQPTAEQLAPQVTLVNPGADDLLTG